ncbi:MULTISPECIES: DUF2007 domain-containing protein [Thermomicrobium]|jgi:hypothetical protein|uniref:Uncharacterized protein n=1 Tax=Thermomicrobium roseum (strain ATCC 27502 / DSM 5159 / P-2) TaxID=309801 RepID=B9KYW5_THERP|nr:MULTISPECIES: DUF2007 domain-containing protein [Thermomicrobium]ACM05279.1 conserved hypothetical protein [Thermomicrobium roseum DSM 5159]MBO9305687.1 DUF2007 domain-containing protein [Thermomicrobium sp.]MBO9349986.1 DUF2007 domain-containing protein [Thermomicrobium sp.]MBO9358754.1 DUF2007 domain-containing protein [Thermomicrobium sp.]MBO9385047.1 DUF2007 domain-containing protein [Thermomicrobium sp.]
MTADDELVQVAVAPNEIVAALWQGALEEEGIPVLVKVLGLGYAYWSPFVADRALFVRRQDAERAKEILASLSEE